MDIRSIIDTDDAPPPRKRSAPGSGIQDYRSRPAGYPNPHEVQTPTYQERRDGRPPQPSPLQTPGHSDYGANGPSHSAVRSPYQQTPPSGLNSGQYIPPQIPSQSPVHGPQYSQRENNSSSSAPVNRSFGPSTPLSQTPTTSTPGSAHGYSNLGRPSSSHSVPTPNSGQQPPSYFRDSPQATHTQSRTLSQSQTGPQYMSQPSQPSTPLGPPSTFVRSNFSLRRESPGSYNREQPLPGGTYAQPQAASPSPATAGSPQSYGVRHSQSMSHEPINLHERERSLSVSPKTRLPSLPSLDSEMNSADAGTWNEQVTPAKRKVEANSPDMASVREPTMNRKQSKQSRMSSIGVNGLLNAAPTIEPPERVNRHSQSETPLTLNSERKSTSFDYIPRTHTSSATLHANLLSVPQMPSNAKMSPSAKVEASALINSPSKKTKKRAHDHSPANDETKRSVDLEEIAPPTNQDQIPSQPAKKRPRLGDSPSNPMPVSIENNDASQSTSAPESIPEPKSTTEKKQKPSRWKEIPIWAHSVPRHNRHPNGNPRRQAPRQAPIALAPAQSSGQPNSMQGANGHSNQANGVHVPVAQPTLANTGPLGPWEPSFLNIIPAEELVRIISDWLFQNVVQRDDVGVGPAGGGTGGGAVLEIEAKIGQLIDKNTNDRLRLPVLNECVVSHSDPNIRIAFKSSMTEIQHKAFNQFLNEAVRQSKIRPTASPTSKPRIPMDYKHTKETDTFYDLTQAGALALPQSIASGLNINPRHANKSKVRITTDQKTGKVLAKIIKARVADIDIYSPRTLFDWRISVNVEMDYKGETTDLVEPQTRDGKQADRNKDRMSYKHLAYQIDLTQVTPAEGTSKTEKEHELEIEVSSEEVRRQGQLLMHGQVSQYEDLIRGFVDNVRVLARHCQS